MERCAGDPAGRARSWLYRIATARATLGDRDVSDAYRGDPATSDDAALLKRYVATSEAFDLRL